MVGIGRPVEKVCPVVKRRSGSRSDILAFEHPLAGKQLVKGTLEPGEDVWAGALRELAEESGIFGSVDGEPTWSSPGVVDGQIWHFVPVTVPDLPEQFSFHTADDDGHDFRFFWWSLHAKAGEDWHESFVRAITEIRARLESDD